MEARLQALSPLDEVSPSTLFGGLSQDAWRWLHLEGRDRCPFLERYLPGLTGDPSFEALVVGSSGTKMLAKGFEIYELFKGRYEQHVGPLTSSARVLDFGCGFGRVIRFFLKDVAPENLFGIDVDERRLAASGDHWSQYRRCETFPPTDFEAESFDFIYAFSVFSHLSEEAHARWLEEFERLLKPGALLILTTFRRDEIVNRPPPIDECLASPEPWLSAYDRGDFCYQPQGARTPHFGYAFIPELYVREHWTKRFVVREYFEAAAYGQNIIVCAKE
jgi:SAM-dependent methyltransferase